MGRFNPLPALKLQGDAIAFLLRPFLFCFNPLPAPEYREIGAKSIMQITRERFNRSLHQSTGRFIGLFVSSKTYIVSIRSLHQSTGRFASGCSRGQVSRLFQSAPCTRVQGDQNRQEQMADAIVVSIRSLHQEYREIDSGKVANAKFDYVSIRSLHQSTGRSVQEFALSQVGSEFQSAPCTRVQGDQATTK